jgi:hypothetical protein
MYITFLKPANNPTGVDQGFCISYYKLSYRRKLIRTFWIFAFSLILIPLFIHKQNSLLWIGIIFLGGVIQGVYNYYKWKEKEL